MLEVLIRVSLAIAAVAFLIWFWSIVFSWVV